MPSLVLLMWLTLCAEQDVRQREIANGLTLGAAAAALIYLFVTGHTWMGADASEGGWALAICMVLTLPGYIMGRFGAADVKLLAALALASDRNYLLGTVIGAGVIMLVWLFSGRWAWTHMSQKLRKRLQYFDPASSRKQPFAPFLLLGFLLSLAWIH
ncbi:prepilin peptidase [Pseudomonas sp. R5(2019)]|uniref:prepilin peptidase n=1 Tax=Pseudomonas sp. R5(2019) TaxID=2697566 RepID=UPI0014131E04|nr:prepilin peptidase [Pseudomonas sp. R5(2019)]NBA95070.1 prepilin peptidase [Pseudomonas sp. R5(2019)]